jgi:hypothetical protein
MVAFGWTNRYDAGKMFEVPVPQPAGPPGHENPIPRIHNGVQTPNNLRHCDARTLKLYEILINPQPDAACMTYTYQCLGELWQHSISFLGQMLPGSPGNGTFYCVGGEGHGCSEGIGGVYAWKELLAAYDAGIPNIEQRRKIERFQKDARNNTEPGGLSGYRKWEWDKAKVNRLLEELDFHPKSNPASVGPKRSILLISLDMKPSLGKAYARVVAELRSRAIVREVTSMPSAMYHLSGPPVYQSVIVTDPAVFRPAFADLEVWLSKYAKYVSNCSKHKVAVIFGFQCGSLDNQFDVDSLEYALENDWGLGWKVGDRTSTTFSLNPQVNGVFQLRQGPDLLKEYHMNARELKGTSFIDRIYISHRISGQSPAIFSKHGYGYIGWIGDADGGGGTTELLLKMCGI